MGRTADIKLKIDGTGVTPASLPLDDLTFIVHHYRDAVLKHATDDDRIQAGEVVALIGVEKGSATPVVRFPDRFRPVAYSLTESLHANTHQQRPTESHRILAEISKRCQQRGFFVRLPGTRGKHFDIGAGHPFEVPPPPTFVESAVLYGTVRSAGGANPHAEIVTDNGKAVTVYADEPLIIELAKCLYQTIGLEGDGTYDAESHQLKSFRALRRTEFEETDLIAAFEELAAVSQGVWDGVDPVDYVHTLREEE